MKMKRFLRVNEHTVINANHILYIDKVADNSGIKDERPNYFIRCINGETFQVTEDAYAVGLDRLFDEVMQ